MAVQSAVDSRKRTAGIIKVFVVDYAVIVLVLDLPATDTQRIVDGLEIERHQLA